MKQKIIFLSLLTFISFAQADVDTILADQINLTFRVTGSAAKEIVDTLKQENLGTLSNILKRTVYDGPGFSVPHLSFHFETEDYLFLSFARGNVHVNKMPKLGSKDEFNEHVMFKGKIAKLLTPLSSGGLGTKPVGQSFQPNGEISFTGPVAKSLYVNRKNLKLFDCKIVDVNGAFSGGKVATCAFK